jgi:hypothetical protein
MGSPLMKPTESTILQTINVTFLFSLPFDTMWAKFRLLWCSRAKGIIMYVYPEYTDSRRNSCWGLAANVPALAGIGYSVDTGGV